MSTNEYLTYTAAINARARAAYLEVALCEAWLMLDATRRIEERQASHEAMIYAQERGLALAKELRDGRA